MDDFSPVRTPRTFEVIVDRIRERIRAGTLRPGDKLPAERALAEQLGASRNAVREALRALERAGLITLVKGAHGGAFISDGSSDAVSQTMQDLLHLGSLSLDDVTEARLLIEAAVVEVAAERASSDDLDRLAANVDAAERLTAAGDLAAKTELNIEFHNLLAECTGNPVLAIMMKTLMDLLRRVHRPVAAEDTADIIQSRRRFLAQLRAGDAAAARAEMAAHLARLHRLTAG